MQVRLVACLGEGVEGDLRRRGCVGKKNPGTWPGSGEGRAIRLALRTHRMRQVAAPSCQQ